MRQQSVFEIWMRTGLWPEPNLEPAEEKFNPWHDPDDGRFTFAHQGQYFAGGVGTLSRSQATAPDVRQPVPKPHLDGGVSHHAPAHREDSHDRLLDGFKKHIVPFENSVDVVYEDTRGNLTVGIGHKLPSDGKLKRGDRVSPAQIEAFWRSDADTALNSAREQMREAGITDQNFLFPLASGNFQLGKGWRSKFVKTWNLIKARRYGEAAREAEDSNWFRSDAPNRVRAFQQALSRLERAEQARRIAQRNSDAGKP